MNSKMLSVTNRKLSNRIIYPIIRRYVVSVTQQSTKEKATARSFFVRFIENRRKKIQQEDIRLEPYTSKGVYTESGAIRPMPKRYPLGIVKVLLVTAPFLYLGSLVSKYAALGLEKMELFVYSDDDDDDDDDD